MTDDTSMAILLAGQLDRILAARVDTAAFKAAEAGEVGAELAKEIAALELALAIVPEDQGGAGLSWSDLGHLLQALGYHAAPVTLGEDIVANRLLADAAMERVPAVAIASDMLVLENGLVSGSCVLQGSVHPMSMLVVAASATGHRLCVIDLAGGQECKLATIGRDPRTRITFHGASPRQVSAQAVAEDILLAPLAVLRATQIAGALSRILEMSIDYGNTRVQFGRPIGKFQAIQHMVAELAAEAAAASAAVQIGLRCLDQGRLLQAASVAKIRTSRAAGKGAAIAHEVHGAIGVTDEFALHYFTRRLWQWRDEAGDEHAWSERLGNSILASGGDRLWPDLVSLSA